MHHIAPGTAKSRRSALSRRVLAGVAVAVVGASTLLGSGAAFAANPEPQQQLDQSNTSGSASNTSTVRWWQTFTPAVNGEVSQIDLNATYVDRSSSVSVSIQSVNSAGDLTGTVLATGQATVSQTGWLSVPISATDAVSAGTRYAIVLDPKNVSFQLTGDTYTRGNPHTSSTSYSYYDLAFREYVKPQVAAISGTPTTNVPVNHAYEFDYAVGGSASTQLLLGRLPDGLKLSTDGVISGTPTQTGTYWFTVRATVGTSKADINSSIVVRPEQTPGVPTDVAATVGSSSAVVSWTAPAPGDQPIDHYTVTASTDGISTTTLDTSATIPGLTPGTNYTFTVSATSAAGTGGTSSKSNTVTPYTTPSAPISVAATAGDTQAEVAWKAPHSDGFSPLTGYLIFASQDGAEPVQVGAAGAEDTKATITGLTNGGSYVFTVAATNVAGTGPTASSDPATPFGLASSPLALQATVDNAKVTLTWAAPESDNGSKVTNYVVEYSADGEHWVDAAYDAEGTSFTVAQLTNGQAYSFRVAAINVAGNGAWSTIATATPITVATAPADVTVVPTDGAATIAWTAPTTDGGTPITNYAIEYRTATSKWIDAGTSASSPLAVSGLNNGTAYEFRVFAINAAGTGAASEAATGTPFVFNPTAQNDSATVEGKTLEVGDTVHLHAAALPVGSIVTIELHSSTVTLGTVTIGENGVLDTDVVLPAATAAGKHELTLTLSNTGADAVTAAFGFTVAQPTAATVTTAVTKTAVQKVTTLAFTGSTVSPALLGAAGLVTVAGAVLLIMGRRRRA